MSGLTWLGLDPGLTNFGWCVFKDPDSPTQSPLVDAGLWQTERDEKFTKKGMRKAGRKTKPAGVTKDTEARVRHLVESVHGLIEKYRPAMIFTEAIALPFKMTSVISISTLGQLRGALVTLSIVHSLPLVTYAAQTLKRHFTGAGGGEEGDKEAVAKRVLQLVPALRVLLPAGKVHENVTDAVATAIMGTNSDEIEWHRKQLGRNAGQLELGAPRPPAPLSLEALELPPDLAGGAPI